MNEIRLTKNQAFLAMYSFLDGYYQATKSDDVGGILGGISLLPDGSLADPATKEDWDAAVQSVMSGKVNAELQIKNT